MRLVSFFLYKYTGDFREGPPLNTVEIKIPLSMKQVKRPVALRIAGRKLKHASGWNMSIFRDSVFDEGKIPAIFTVTGVLGLLQLGV